MERKMYCPTEKQLSKWSKMDTTRTTRTTRTHPSFKAQYGRQPIVGVDYDPDGMSQDEYEYLTGTGQYSD